MQDNDGRGSLAGFRDTWKRIDERLGSLAQAYVDRRAASGVSLPAILRDAVFHSFASFALAVMLSFLTDDPSTVCLLVLLLILVAPGELRNWRRHAARASAGWSLELAAACMAEADLRKRAYFWLRALCVLAGVAETIGLTLRPASLTPSDMAGVIMIVVFGSRLYLERSLPRPPSERRQPAGKLAPQA